MKSFAVGLIGCLLTISFALAALSQYNIAIRRNELEQAVPYILYTTLEMNYHGSRTDEEVRNLVCSRISQEIMTDSELTIAVPVCDMQKGILSVKVEESFLLPSGRRQSVVVSRTAIVEREADLSASASPSLTPVSPSLAPASPSPVHASPSPAPAGDDIWNDAVMFCNRYGNETVFHPVSDSDGMILYGTLSPRGQYQETTYRTIGWKLMVKGVNDALLQTIYLIPGGEHLQMIDSGEENGYCATLYGISLQELLGLLQESSRQAVESGRSHITMDACMTVAEEGEPCGSITDDGSVSGEVYDSYEGIAGAREWTDTARTALGRYFGRTIRGLFYTITLQGDEGVQALQGGGNYCYGSLVTIRAELKEDYEFRSWSGSSEETSESFLFRVNENGSWRAQTAYVDREPSLQVCDLYYALEDVLAGRITENRILSHYAASDKEDGTLSPGNGLRACAQNGESVQESLLGLAEGMLEGGSEEERLGLLVTAADTAGHVVTQSSCLTILDTGTAEKRSKSRIRFISQEFYRTAEDYVSLDRGGLLERSVWKLPDYRSVLDHALTGI